MVAFRRLQPQLARQDGVRLVLPNFVDPRLVLTRAQAGGAFSLAQQADGIAWQEYAADVPRLSGVPRRLLIGGARTNSLTNPRCEGAVAGTPGTMPTAWVAATTLGLTVSVVGSGVEDGIPYVDIQFSGSPSSTGSLQINHSNVAIPASVGQVWTYSLFSRLVGGSLTNVGNATPSLVALATPGGTPYALTTASLGTTRRTTTVTAAGGGSTVLPRWRCAVTIGLAVDFTVRLGLPALELAAFASSPIVPAVGTPAASTRGADVATASLASLGITGGFTVLWSGVVPQNAPNGADQMLFQVDDGTDANRVRIRNVAGGATIVAGHVAASVSSDAATLGSMAAGAPLRAGLTYDPATGRLAACIGGGAVQTVTAGPAGLTTDRLGNNVAGLAPLFGEVSSFIALPGVLTDAGLAARVSGLAV